MIISGGGTGGHVFPAIAIAGALKDREEGIELLFVGANGKMEMEKVPEAGYAIKGLWISGLQRRLTWSNLLFPLKLITSLIKAGTIIRTFKPDVAVGVGGYASGPLLYMAARKGIPCLIQEQNSYPGITNKLLAKKVGKVCVAYEGMERFFPKDTLVLTGNPVRKNVLQQVNRQEAAAHFGLDPGKKTLLVVGGSLGARTINEALVGGLEKIARSGYQLIWQTGRFYYKEMTERSRGHMNERLQLLEFINRMDYAYSMADVVISRAGAIAISELCLVKKPVILVPSANVAEDHQTKNARALTDRKAARMVTDAEATEKLVDEALALLDDEQQQQELSTYIAVMGQPDAAAKIAEEVLKLIRH